jgi:hypothetical protein
MIHIALHFTSLPQLYEQYELHIYTMGTRAYARTVARILDASGKLFGDRILSRDDGFDQVSHRSYTIHNRRLFLIDVHRIPEICFGIPCGPVASTLFLLRHNL